MNKSKVSILVFIGLIILAISTVSNGASTNTFKAGVTANVATLKPGEEVTVTVGVLDINMGENGINTLEGKIKYDTNIFEEITSSSIQSLNNWTTTYNDESSTLNGKFLAVNLSSGIKENTQIFSVKFKVKSDVKDSKDTTIEFQEITSNDGTDLVNVGTKSVTIKINGGTSENQNTNQNTAGGNTINNGNTNTTNKNTSIVDKTQSTTKLPNTGKSIVLMVALVGVIIAVVVLAIKNRTMKDIK